MMSVLITKNMNIEETIGKITIAKRNFGNWLECREAVL